MIGVYLWPAEMFLSPTSLVSLK